MKLKLFIYLLLFLFSFRLTTEAQKVGDPSAKPEKTKKQKDFGKSFFEKDSIHIIRINFVQCNYWDSLVQYRKYFDSLNVSQYMQASVTVNEKTYYSCGIRFKGESSYEFYPGKKKPFRIKFDKFIKSQDMDGLDEINLNNNFKDPTMMREKIYLDLLNRKGLPAPRATYAKVYLNEKYLGLYLVTENINSTFLKTRFGDAKGNLFQGEPLATFKYYGNQSSDYYNKFILKNNGNVNDWSDLVSFISLINDTTLSEDIYLRKLESAFNLDKCLRAWAINNLMLNIDAYNMFYPHNFFIYHDNITNKWNWISLDGNYAFAAWNPVMSIPSLLKMSILVPDGVPFKDVRPLLDNTLGRNNRIRKRYLAIVNDLLQNEFSEKNISDMVDSLSLRIRFAVYADINKMYSNKDFDTNLTSTIGDPLDPGNFIPGLKSLIHDRRKYVLEEIQKLNKQISQ